MGVFSLYNYFMSKRFILLFILVLLVLAGLIYKFNFESVGYGSFVSDDGKEVSDYSIGDSYNLFKKPSPPGNESSMEYFKSNMIYRDGGLIGSGKYEGFRRIFVSVPNTVGEVVYLFATKDYKTFVVNTIRWGKIGSYKPVDTEFGETSGFNSSVITSIDSIPLDTLPQ